MSLTNDQVQAATLPKITPPPLTLQQQWDAVIAQMAQDGTLPATVPTAAQLIADFGPAPPPPLAGVTFSTPDATYGSVLFLTGVTNPQAAATPWLTTAILDQLLPGSEAYATVQLNCQLARTEEADRWLIQVAKKADAVIDPSTGNLTYVLDHTTAQNIVPNIGVIPSEYNTPELAAGYVNKSHK